MKRRWLRRTLILAAAAVLCVVMSRVSFGGRRGSTGMLTLWYAQSDCPAAVMEGFAARCREETGLWIETAGFADESALGAAFESARPGLLFCSSTRAGGLAERGRLGMAAQPVPVPDQLREAMAGLDRSFLPIGSRLPLLLVNTALDAGTYESLEALLAAADRDHPLASDAWAEMLYTAVYAAGGQMRGEEEADGRDAAYREVWNALAEAAFRGGLVTTPDAADYVRQGLIRCAVVRSTALAGLEDKGLEVRPLPLPSGAERRFPAELMGFAVIDGADTETAGIFLNWLAGSRTAGGMAVAAGLVPLDGNAAGRTAIEKTLVSFRQDGALCWPGQDAAFYGNRESCEQRLDRRLDLLD